MSKGQPNAIEKFFANGLVIIAIVSFSAIFSIWGIFLSEANAWRLAPYALFFIVLIITTCFTRVLFERDINRVSVLFGFRGHIWIWLALALIIATGFLLNRINGGVPTCQYINGTLYKIYFADNHGELTQISPLMYYVTIGLMQLLPPILTLAVLLSNRHRRFLNLSEDG